ncbi:MAG: hypothetical protein U0136_15935 [Bdellovibrionota bacterium]
MNAIFFHDGDGHPHGSPMFAAKSGNVQNLYALPCMQNIFAACGVPAGEVPQQMGFEKFRDDCIFLSLASKWAVANGKPANYCGQMSAAATQCAHSGARCKSVGDQVAGHCRSKALTVVLDNSTCNGTKNPVPANQICGNFNAVGLYTPISLLWNDKADLQSQYNIVEFKMNPNAPAAWHTWRGSAVTPLVVFDPEHKGVVTSGAQLFGEWTFGGKSYASLNELVDGSQKSKWNDGFDALAQLDSNHNQKIDGDELTSLALWFDNNQDAVSQPGEVVSIRDTGVTALFYSHDGFDPVTKTIKASVGFERIVDGKTVRGASVDWYGETAASKLEMLQKEQARVLLNGQAAADVSTVGANPSAAQVDDESLTAARRFTGPWVWTLDGEHPLDPGSPTSGVLVFTLDESSRSIGGSSYTVTPLEDSHKVAHVGVSRAGIEGRLVEMKGEQILQFEALDTDKVLAQSAVRISPDGMTLTGESSSKVLKSANSSETTTVKYRWTARRY